MKKSNNKIILGLSLVITALVHTPEVSLAGTRDQLTNFKIGETLDFSLFPEEKSYSISGRNSAELNVTVKTIKDATESGRFYHCSGGVWIVLKEETRQFSAICRSPTPYVS